MPWDRSPRRRAPVDADRRIRRAPPRRAAGSGAGAPIAQRRRMRFIVVATVALLSLPAAARPHKRPHPHARATAIVKVVPNDRAAQEHARAEAELSDLRAGRVDEDKA